jgi:hypothetical protein
MRRPAGIFLAALGDEGRHREYARQVLVGEDSRGIAEGHQGRRASRRRRRGDARLDVEGPATSSHMNFRLSSATRETFLLSKRSKGATPSVIAVRR